MTFPHGTSRTRMALPGGPIRIGPHLPPRICRHSCRTARWNSVRSSKSTSMSRKSSILTGRHRLQMHDQVPRAGPQRIRPDSSLFLHGRQRLGAIFKPERQTDEAIRLPDGSHPPQSARKHERRGPATSPLIRLPLATPHLPRFLGSHNTHPH